MMKGPRHKRRLPFSMPVPQLSRETGVSQSAIWAAAATGRVKVIRPKDFRRTLVVTDSFLQDFLGLSPDDYETEAEK